MAIDVFERAVEFVLRQEGGWTTDTGGATRYGISQRAYPDLDLSTLGMEDAKRIYRRDYWDSLGLGDLPEPVATAILDAAVNAGRVPAARMLQRAVNRLAGRPCLVVDGIIGPCTKRAVNALARDDSAAVILGLMVAMSRLDLHYRLAARAEYAAYLRGWAGRCVRLCEELAQQWAAKKPEETKC